MNSRKKLVIIGGGFAGLRIARDIDKRQWEVMIIDKNNYHSFPPLFYQVASAGLEPASISFPLRRELRGRRYSGCTFHIGTVRRIDTAAKRVHTDYETVAYDSLVIAAGTTNNFFGIPDLQKHVCTIKSTTEAIRTRNEVINNLERASLSTDPAERCRLLTFVVVGGGPAGVEIAGALGELKRFALRREYPLIRPDEMRVVLVEGSNALLGAMGPRSSADALKGLRQLMVDVRLGVTMKNFDGNRITFADGTEIEVCTVIWTAGVTGVTFTLGGTDIRPGRGARFAVDEHCAVEGLKDVYAVGDIALMTTEKYPHGHPQVAQVAMQMGAALARNLSNPERRSPFVYHDKGSMATIGRNRAVVDMGKMHLSGWFAWFTWLTVHLMSLLGMRNRAMVLLNWIWNYWTFSGGYKLLFRPDRYPVRTYWER